MSLQGRQMHLGLFILGSGHHVAGWRMPGAEAGAENLSLLQRTTRTAERGKLDLIFLADALNAAPGIDGMTLCNDTRHMHDRESLATASRFIYSLVSP